MIEFRNYHFVISNKTVDVGKDHQQLLTFLGEKSIQKLKMDGSGWIQVLTWIQRAI